MELQQLMHSFEKKPLENCKDVSTENNGLTNTLHYLFKHFCSEFFLLPTAENIPDWGMILYDFSPLGM